ncbi:hypothetical protein FRC19_011659, partial [Serendipita sp. 401]
CHPPRRNRQSIPLLVNRTTRRSNSRPLIMHRQATTRLERLETILSLELREVLELRI